MQNTTEFRILISDEMALLIKTIENRKGLDIHIRKIYYIISKYNIDNYLYAKIYN